MKSFSTTHKLLITSAGVVAAFIGGQLYLKGGVCTSGARLDGKTVVVTGCNTGIGRETAADLARRGGRVIMACRNVEAAEEAAKYARWRAGGAAEVAVYRLDLASLSSVRSCAEKIAKEESRVDVLINNAGVAMCPHQQTEDGFEMQIGTNHFGHFLFTNLLLDKLKSSAPSRIVNVSSRAHRGGHIDFDDINYERRKYSGFGAYKQSKLANVLFTRELARRLKGSGVTCYVVHPGLVRTDLFRHIEDAVGPLKYLAWPLVYLCSKSPIEGAQTTIYCAVEESLSEESGHYYSDCARADPAPQAKDDDDARRLWKVSEQAVGIARLEEK